jgi:hypothetical protein
VQQLELEWQKAREFCSDLERQKFMWYVGRVLREGLKEEEVEPTTPQFIFIFGIYILSWSTSFILKIIRKRGLLISLFCPSVCVFPLNFCFPCGPYCMKDAYEINLLSASPLIFSLLSLFWNTKFWEEIIADFPSIWHGPHRKQPLQQFFIATGTSVPSCYLATIGGYTDQHTRPTILLLLRVFVAVGTC